MNGGTPVVWIFKVKSFSLLLLFRVLLNKTEKLSCLLLIRTKHANIIYRLYSMSPLTALLKFIQKQHILKTNILLLLLFCLDKNFYKLAINSESRRGNRLLMSEEYSRFRICDFSQFSEIKGSTCYQ